MIDCVTVTPFAHQPKGHELDYQCPPDKSLTHRALMLAASAAGQSRIYNPLLGADCRSTLEAVRKLGVEVEEHADVPMLTLQSPGRCSWSQEPVAIDCANSGTTARLLLGLLASTPGIQVTLTGDRSLHKRPMGRVCHLLESMGARFPRGSDYLPIEIAGQALQASQMQSAVASAQVKSALLFAAMNVDGVCEITLPTGSRDHTENMLLAMGAPLTITADGVTETLRWQGPWEPMAKDWAIPGDPSSAAYVFALAVLTGRAAVVRQVLTNPRRCGFFDVMEEMGASFVREVPVRHGKSLSRMSVESCADFRVAGQADLRGTSVTASRIPTLIDEIPLLAVVMARSEGVSRLEGLSELRVKESDRLAKTAELVTLAGGVADIQGDDLIITGRQRDVRGFQFDAVGDHRLAMTAGMLGTLADSSSQVMGGRAVAISFPDYWELMDDFAKVTF